MFTIRFLIRVSVLLVVLLGATTSQAEDFYWSGGCGNEWESHCAGASCNETQYYIYNNWGRELCGDIPPVPGMNDTAHMEFGTAVIFADNISVASLDLGPEATVFVDAFADTNRYLFLHGATHHNDGAILVNLPDGGGRCHLFVQHDAAIDGSGQIVLGKYHSFELAILDTGDGATLTNGPQHTISGRGHVHGAIANQGFISADVAGSVLHLLGKDKSNAGTMEARNGGLLYLDGIAIVQSETGVIAADDGTVVLQGDVAVSGGHMATAGEGEVQIRFAGNTIGDVSVDADAVVAVRSIGADSVLQLAGGTIVNDGLLRISSDNETGRCTMRAIEDVAVEGSGTILLDKLHQFELANLDTAEGVTLTNGSDHTIKGRGHIHAAIHNQGLIAADVAGSTLYLLDEDCTNAGSIEARSGSHLIVEGISITQSESGHIVAEGGTVTLQGNAAVAGGHVDTEGESEVQVRYGNNTFDGVTVDAGATVAVRSIGADSVLQLAGGTIVNDGLLRVSSGSETGRCTMRAVEDVTVTGSGTILLDKYHQYELANLDTAEGVTLTNGAGQTIKGRGHVHAALINEGVFAVEQAGYTITVVPQAPGMINEGILRVVADGWMYIQSAGLFTQSGGSGEIDGTLAMSGGPFLLDGGVLTGSGTVSGGVDNLGGVIEPGSPVGRLHVTGAYVQGEAGRLTIEVGDADAGECDRLAITGSADLDGELFVLPVGGSIPAPGTQFTILTAGSVTGTFASISGPGAYALTYNPQSVVMTVQSMPGDYDDDGDIDLHDYSSFPDCMSGPKGAAGFVPPSVTCREVFDMDWEGDVDVVDFAVLQRGFSE
jgi:hypothetical protein